MTVNKARCLQIVTGFLIGLFVVSSCGNLAAQTPTETLLGAFREGGSGGFSHRWLAYIIDEGVLYVDVNGQRLGPYTKLSQRFEISADGEHIAFAAEKDGKWQIVVDGQEKWEHEGLGWVWFAWTPDLEGKVFIPQTQAAVLSFSPDGSHVAYLVSVGEQWATALDGEPGPAFENTSINPQFVGDDLVYSATGPAGDVVVFGEKTLGPFDRDSMLELKFSADCEHFAFAAERGGEWVLVKDGKEDQTPGEVISYELGPAGELAYAARSGDAVRVYWNGQELAEEYDEVSYLTPSPDGKHLAHWARQGNSWSVWTDNGSFPGFDGYYFYESGGEIYCFLWDQSSKNLAYFARRGEETILALNGEEQTMPDFPGIAFQMYVDDAGKTVGVGLMNGPALDRQAFVECLLQRGEVECDPVTATLARGELAHIETGDDGAYMVVGTTREGPYATIRSVLFNFPNGDHYAYVVGTDEGERVVLDGKLMEWTYESIYRPQFVGDRGFAHLGRRGNDVYSVFYPYP